MSGEEIATVRRSRRVRWWLVHLLQLPAVAVVLVAPRPAVLWPVCLAASVLCCAGTDSGWRWRNRLLVAEAALWLTVALVFGA